MEDKCTEERFLRDVAKHKMTVVRDDGVNRYIRFKQPDTINMAFNLITWPGHLCYTGDMGTFVFHRLEDMFEFFRTGRCACHATGQRLFINTGYWGEKCIAVDSSDGIRKYSPDLFTEVINQWLKETLEEREGEPGFEENKSLLSSAVEDEILSCADEGEHSARAAADGFRFDWNGEKVRQIYISDFWERILTEKSFRFVWCCYAVAWGIEQYDQSQAESEVVTGKHTTLTCVYCGMAYPEGTPSHGSQILTDHIKTCKKHPIRKAEAEIARLRKALTGLVGAETSDELETLEIGIRIVPAPDADKAVMINAIHALLESA
ncbi:MAG: hypothetical protein V1844_09830 [Pseudomonadota bacterium]